MARLFGLIGNRVDVTNAVLVHEAGALRAGAGASGWGIGFHQAGEVLVRRRPISLGATVDFAALCSDVRADAIVGHVQGVPEAPSVARVEGGPPFRYRQWLFAQTGRLPHFERFRAALVESVPGFLRSGIRGDTDAELLFHVFLSFLHDAGQLSATASHDATAEALASAVAQVDAMAADAGGEGAGVNVVVSDGVCITALRRGAPMAVRSHEGRSAAERLFGIDTSMRSRIPEAAQLRVSLVASDFEDGRVPEDWHPVELRAIVQLRRGFAPIIR